MLGKINLSIVCLLLVTLFAAQPCLAVTVSIQPDQIILNAEGNSAKGQSTTTQTIQASIPGTGMVKECEATLTITFDGKTTGAISNSGSHYCVVDDILHIKFDREDVLAALDAAGIGSEEGDVCDAAVWADINPDGDPDVLEGNDNVTVIAPKKSPK